MSPDASPPQISVDLAWFHVDSVVRLSELFSKAVTALKRSDTGSKRVEQLQKIADKVADAVEAQFTRRSGRPPAPMSTSDDPPQMALADLVFWRTLAVVQQMADANVADLAGTAVVPPTTFLHDVDAAIGRQFPDLMEMHGRIEAAGYRSEQSFTAALRFTRLAGGVYRGETPYGNGSTLRSLGLSEISEAFTVHLPELKLADSNPAFRNKLLLEIEGHEHIASTCRWDSSQLALACLQHYLISDRTCSPRITLSRELAEEELFGQRLPSRAREEFVGLKQAGWAPIDALQRAVKVTTIASTDVRSHAPITRGDLVAWTRRTPSLGHPVRRN